MVCKSCDLSGVLKNERKNLPVEGRAGWCDGTGGLHITDFVPDRNADSV